MHQNRQHRRQNKTTGRGHVGVGDIFIACDHMVQVDHIAARHGQQAAQPINLARPTTPPHQKALARADDRKGQGGEKQDGE